MRPFVKRKILLAEDDGLVRLVTGRVLEEFADEVVEVATGDAALAALCRGTFDLLVTDLRMPGVNGLDVLQASKECNENCPVVLISGYADDAIARRVDELGGTLLHKPFGARKMRDLIADLLAART